MMQQRRIPLTEESKVKKDKQGGQWLAIALTCVFAGIHIFMLLRHEMWRDEAYVWVMVKNASVKEIFSMLPVVGHPCLWFIYLLPFAKLGLPFECIGVLSAVPMIAAVYIFMSDKEVSGLLKAVCLGSSVFFFYNTVVARPYCFSVLLIVLLMRFWKSRREHAMRYCIAAVLLSWTHVIFAGFCGGILLELWFSKDNKEERNKGVIPSSIVLFAGLALMVLQVWQFDPSASSRPVDAGSLAEYINKEHLTEGLLSIFYYNGKIVKFALMGLTLAALFYFTRSAVIDRRAARYRSCIPAICGVGWFVLIVLFIRPVEHVQMAACLIMMIFFMLYTILTELRYLKKAQNIVASVLLVLFAASTIRFTFTDALRDIKGPYSGSMEAAEFMIRELPEGAVLGFEERQDSEAPYAYMVDKRKDIEYINAWKKEGYTYYRWMKFKRPAEEEICAAVKEAAGNSGAYYLSSKELDMGDMAEQVFGSSTESIWHEQYYLYRIK